MTRLIDLSVTINVNSQEPAPMKIEKILHGPGAKLVCTELKKALTKNNDSKPSTTFEKKELEPSDFPNAEFLSNEIVTASTHTGTHVDAPWHYGPTCAGLPSKKISEIPLEFCFGDGVLLDMTHKVPESLIETADIWNALERIEYRLKVRDIVLIRTDFYKFWGSQDYYTRHPGMSRAATKLLVDQGIKMIGIDTYGFDRPFFTMVREYLASGDPSHLWPAHFFGREIEYYHIERLANLDKIPRSHGFTVACFPIKIDDAGAAWTRAVAIV